MVFNKHVLITVNSFCLLGGRVMVFTNLTYKWFFLQVTITDLNKFRFLGNEWLKHLMKPTHEISVVKTQFRDAEYIRKSAILLYIPQPKELWNGIFNYVA